jgi:phosphonate transport system substrate-binding protein
MTYSARLILLVCITLILPVCVFAEESLQEEVVIGLIPEINVFEQAERYNHLTEYLTKKTGIKITTKVLIRYGNILDNFNNINLDGAFFGSFTGAIAHIRLNLEPLARPVNMDGTSTYHGHIIVRKDSGIKSVKDMKDKTMAFVDKATTAGYIFPLAYLKENGIADINEFFKEYYFAGSHDHVANDVLNKKADIGALKNTVYDKMLNENPRIKEELVILADSAQVPSNSLCLKKTIDKNIRRKLKTALLNMDRDVEGIKVLEKFRAINFIDTSETDYEVVLDIVRKAGIDINEYDYMNN